MTRAQTLGSILLAGCSLISIALSIDLAYDDADPVTLLWGVVLGVVPLLLIAWSMRSRSTALLEIAGWACSAILFAIVIHHVLVIETPLGGFGDFVALFGVVYLVGAFLLTLPRARRLPATRI